MNVTSEFNYSFEYWYSFEFERNYDYNIFYDWMKEKWHYSFYIVATYLTLVWIGRRMMEVRQRFELKTPLFCWNVFLAVFSLVCAARLTSELLYTLSTFGFRYTICDSSAKYFNNAAMFWYSLFVLSKVAELGDTAFVVLRKQKLVFLHWFHHITVLLDSWFSVAEENAANRWFVSINSSIHAMMYSYYVFKALKFNIPRVVAMFITFVQLMQMAIGLNINWISYNIIMKGGNCAATIRNIKYSTLMYLSYLILFSNFFYESYFASKVAVPATTKPAVNGIANGHISITSSQRKRAKKE